jgi:hypothetical protein
VVTAALWIAGGILFKLIDERAPAAEPEGEWPGVTILIPAYNEEAVIAQSVQAALASEYPKLEILVLDDGSKDDTSAAATEAAGGDPRCEVVRDEVNRGKAERLNIGFARARHELILVTDADAHLHPHAVRHLVLRLSRSPMVAAVAGAPFVTNRAYLISALQVLESAAVIGLIRRTHSLTGRVGVVAGVCGLFRRDVVLAVGGYEDRMATEEVSTAMNPSSSCGRPGTAGPTSAGRATARSAETGSAPSRRSSPSAAASTRTPVSSAIPRSRKSARIASPASVPKIHRGDGSAVTTASSASGCASADISASS